MTDIDHPSRSRSTRSWKAIHRSSCRQYRSSWFTIRTIKHYYVLYRNSFCISHFYWQRSHFQCFEVRVQKSKQENNEYMEIMAYNLLLKFNRVNGVNLRKTIANNFLSRCKQSKLQQAVCISKLSADELQQMTQYLFRTHSRFGLADSNTPVGRIQRPHLIIY